MENIIEISNSEFAENPRNTEYLLSILKNSNDYSSPKLCLNYFVKELVKFFGFDLASIFLLDKEKNKLRSIASSDNETIIIDSRLGICGEVVRTRETIIVNDAYQDLRFYQKVDQRTGFRTSNIVVVPLLNSVNDVIGTVQLINKVGDDFTKTDKAVLDDMSKHITDYLEGKGLEKELELDCSHKNENDVDSPHTFSTKDIIGSSEKIQNIIRVAELVSNSTVSILINGDSGTGKELVARAIHYSGIRADKPFVAVNCAAIPENLVESELFGIEKGVATDVSQRIGKFEVANRGTIFLDEIGDLSLASQAKVLRVLQSNTVQRVGSSKSSKLDIRVISATNKNLKEEISNGNFREDLFYRLNVVQITTPSLKEIPEDIPLLLNYFLKQYSAEYKVKQKQLSNTAIKLMQQYSWPGNIRELENLIKRLITLVPNKIIDEEHLPDYIRHENYLSQLINSYSDRPLKELVMELERKVISDTLSKYNNNKLKTAKVLGISRQGLINKIKQYSIEN